MMSDFDEPGEIIMDGPCDPDAQATITDFIDYTEYLPSDLIRSLTLIRNLDETYLEAAATVHELTKTYGQLPNIPAQSRPDAQLLRSEISYHLDRAISARESSYAEACRLYDTVDRHHDRLGSIKTKLLALPKPPSREPTPAPAAPSPEAKRSRSGRKVEDNASTTRITLRVDSARPSEQPAPRSRSRRPGAAAHLPSFNPDSPIASTEQSDAEPESATSKLIPRGTAEETEDIDGKTPKSKRQKQPKPVRAPRPPGMGTNVHSSIAGISTSNALALLKPPPEDAKMGGEDLPWLRLTEWEMTKLRKKMKKNAVWQPSEIMIHRELALRGRGWEAYRAAKAKAEAAGEEFVDCDDISTNYVPGKLVRRSEMSSDMVMVEETKLSNRGMKLNEAKKLKRENLAREQAAAAAAEAEMAARRLGDLGSTFKSLFSSPAEQSSNVSGMFGSPSKANGTPVKDRDKAKSPKKRKLEETAPTESPAPAAGDESGLGVAPTSAKPSAKKRKTSKPSPVITQPEGSVTPTAVETRMTPTSVPVIANATSPIKTPTPALSPIGSTSHRSISAEAPEAPPSAATTSSAPVGAAPVSMVVSKTITTKPPPTPTPPVTRPSSRLRSAAASVEPTVPSATQLNRDHLRRKSTTPAASIKTQNREASRPPSGPTAAGTRRSKRPAPGPVSSGREGGAAVSFGRRKAKPTKKKFSSKERESSIAMKEDVRIDEDGVLEEIDPNEPRYCLCGDISFGTMICCENPECDREWFHLNCVGLTDIPSRTAKWYCPDCRIKLGKGVDGIVKVGR